jgi:TonB family protein
MKGISLIALLTMVSCSSYHRPSVHDPVLAEARKFNQCFEESDSFKSASAPGSVELSYNINADGKVENEKIAHSDFQDANFNACLLGIIKEVKFSPRSAQTEVKQPLKFSPRKL